MKLELLKGSRSRILAAVIFGIAAIFVVRLFYLQIIQHETYKARAMAEQQSRFVIPASRGLIYAKSGDSTVQLVMNENVYTVFADPVVVDEKEKVVDVLRKVAGGNLRTDFDKLLDKKDTRYQILATKLTRVQADKIKEENLHGIGFQEVSQRVYPEGSLAAQVLGFVNAEGVGNYGIESALADELKGTDGLLQAVTDVSNVPLTIGNNNIRIPEQDGKNVVLTIDRNIQSRVEQALAAGVQRTGATYGSAMVMDPHTGKIMAMANVPTYNPSEYFKVEDAAAFNNAVISDPYEPGSTIKTFTLATAVDKGAVKTTDTYNNTDSIKIGDNYTVGNATRGQTGIITFQHALTWSLNTGFVTIAQRLGDGESVNRTARDTMYEYFHNRFRMGEYTGIELANEAKGSVISPEDAQGNAVRYATMSFGQGMNATMIQVATGFSALINGGNYYKPTIIDGYMTDEGFDQKPNNAPIATGLISQATSDTLKQAMHDARAESFGRTDKAGYYIGGKTGTSQVSAPGGYSDTESIGSYLGYGGGNEVEYVIMIRVSGKDKQLQGARDALPIFTEISNWMLDYLKIQPKG
ncbi:MAG: penicillin-binding protein 2 [Candidatus Microsaccharimonas sp.]